MSAGRIKTRVALNGWDDHRFRGHAVYADLLGRTSTSQLLALALGVTLGPDDARLLDEMIVSNAHADPHIWPMKLTRVAGAYGGSVMTGVAAGLLAIEGTLAGTGPVVPVATLLHRLAQLDAPDAVVREIHAMLDAGERLPGFGVPARTIDERVVALTRGVVAHGRDQRKYWTLWSQIVDQTRSRGVEPNIVSAFTAAALDLGFPPERIAPLLAMAVLPGFLANAVEGAEQQPEILRALPNDDLEFCGPPRRLSARARAAES